MLFPPILLIGIFAIALKKATGSWFSPGTFFASFWLTFIVLPLAFAPEFEINIYGIWFITLFVMAFSCGSIISIIFLKKGKRVVVKSVPKNKLIISSLIIFSSLSFFGLIMLVFHLISDYSITDLNNFLILPNLISIDRYNEILTYPPILKYSLYFIYPGNIMGGILINSHDNSIKIKILCFIPLILSIMLGLIEGSRTSLLLGFVLFFSTFISTKIIIKKNNFKLSYVKFFLMIFSFFLIIIFLFILVQWLRQGFNPIIFEFLIIRVKVYFFGYLSAFTLWFESVENFSSISFIPSTLAGPLNLIGFLERELGFYNPIHINKYNSTNIFTALRGLIVDFTWIGAILISLLLGVYFQFIFQKQKFYFYDGIISTSIFYSFTLYSPLISIFHYNSIFFSWIIIYIILRLTKE